MRGRLKHMNRTQPSGQLDNIYEEESARLEAQWRKTHFRIMLVLSLVVIAAEASFALVLRNTSLMQISMPLYLVRYLLIPALVYLLLDTVTFCLCRFSQPGGRPLNYVISLAFALLCLSVCFFHDCFVAIYAGGVTAIALTTVYGDQKLTSVTTLVLILGDVFLPLFNRWDSTAVRDETYHISLCLVILIELSTYLISLTVVEWEERRRHAVVLRELEIEDLRRVAARDHLTGVRNRLGLRQYIDGLHGRPVYAMFDVDNFKGVNDRWGHESGDCVLAGLGRILLNEESASLAAFRYGGDEFLLVFPHGNEAEARAVCDAIHAQFAASLSPEMREIGVGLSFGLSAGEAGSPSGAIRAADESLYRSKHGG